ncbi:unnamed protein product, partial [Caenorhabditis brenneri]
VVWWIAEDRKLCNDPDVDTTWLNADQLSQIGNIQNLVFFPIHDYSKKNTHRASKTGSNALTVQLWKINLN